MSAGNLGTHGARQSDATFPSQRRLVMQITFDLVQKHDDDQLPQYESSAEAQRFYFRMDLLGVSFALFNNLVLLLLYSRKHNDITDGRSGVTFASKAVVLVAFLQLIFMLNFRQTACWARHWLAGANRCYRLGLALIAAARTRYNVLGEVVAWLSQQTGGGHSDWAAWVPDQQCCQSPRGFAQLQLFALLLAGVHIPLVTVHKLELHQKTTYYKARGFAVQPDASAFMPCPGLPWSNCFSALVVWPSLLWCCAIAAAEAWVPRGDGAGL
eukprot:gene6656-6881_t